MLQNPNFPGLRPGPRRGSLQLSPSLLSDGAGLAAPSKNPTPTVSPCVYGSQGPTHCRVGNLLMIDCKCRPTGCAKKSDTHDNYGNIMSYKVKKHQIFTLFEQFQHSLLLIHRVMCSICLPCCCTTRIRRRHHSSMLRSMKRCDNLFHSSIMACFS